MTENLDADALVAAVQKHLSGPRVFDSLACVRDTHRLARRIAHTAVEQVAHSNIWTHEYQAGGGPLVTTTQRQVTELADDIMREDPSHLGHDFWKRDT